MVPIARRQTTRVGAERGRALQELPDEDGDDDLTSCGSCRRGQAVGSAATQAGSPARWGRQLGKRGNLRLGPQPERHRNDVGSPGHTRRQPHRARGHHLQDENIGQHLNRELRRSAPRRLQEERSRPRDAARSRRSGATSHDRQCDGRRNPAIILDGPLGDDRISVSRAC